MNRIKEHSRMNVKQCTLCPEYTEYYCHSCQKDLCQRCKLVHVIDLNTKHHEVTIYRDNFNYISKREKCTNHRNCIYKGYCESCEVPVCDSDSDHKPQGDSFQAGLFSKGQSQHKVVNIRTVYQTKRLQHKDWIHNVRSETLYNNLVLLKRLPSYFQTCHSNISRYQNEMIERGQTVKDLRDSVLLDEIKKIRCSFQKIRRKEMIARIQNYEENHEQSANRPVKFLRFIKSVRLPKIQDTRHRPRQCAFPKIQDTVQLPRHCAFPKIQDTLCLPLHSTLPKIQGTLHLQRHFALPKIQDTLPLQRHFALPKIQGTLHFPRYSVLPKIQDTLHRPRHCAISITQEINMRGLIELLSEIQIEEKGKHKPEAGNEFQLNHFTVPGVHHCGHISCVTPDKVWVSEGNYIILTDTRARYPKVLHCVENALHKEGVGLHTVNRNGELINIDMLYNVNKFSCDTKTTTIFIKNGDITWKPLCLYASPFSGDLLVGGEGKIMRYNSIGKLIQIIPNRDTVPRFPRYITENNNGDIVASDYRIGIFRRAVVVTSREGIHRFLYTGPSQSETRIEPGAICTDAFSRILVCDTKTGSLHILNQDGQFLKCLMPTEPIGYNTQYSLSYKTCCMWAGSSGINKLYKFIINRDLSIIDSADLSNHTSDENKRRIPRYYKTTQTLPVYDDNVTVIYERI